MAKKTNVKKQKKEEVPALHDETLFVAYEALKEDKEVQQFLRAREKAQALLNLQEVLFRVEPTPPAPEKPTEKQKEVPVEPETEDPEEKEEEETPTEDQEEEDLEA